MRPVRPDNPQRRRGTANKPDERVKAVEVRLDIVDRRLEGLAPDVQAAAMGVNEVRTAVGRMEGSLREHMDQRVERDGKIDEDMHDIHAFQRDIRAFQEEHGPTLRALYSFVTVGKAVAKVLGWMAAFGAGSVAIYKFVITGQWIPR